MDINKFFTDWGYARFYYYCILTDHRKERSVFIVDLRNRRKRYIKGENLAHIIKNK